MRLEELEYSMDGDGERRELDMNSTLADVPGSFEDPGDIDLAVAFVSGPGLALARPALEGKLESGDRVRLLLDLEEGATDPAALGELVASKPPETLAQLQV